MPLRVNSLRRAGSNPLVKFKPTVIERNRQSEMVVSMPQKSSVRKSRSRGSIRNTVAICLNQVKAREQNDLSKLNDTDFLLAQLWILGLKVAALSPREIELELRNAVEVSSTA